jgi:leucyl aminopeptidase
VYTALLIQALSNESLMFHIFDTEGSPSPSQAPSDACGSTSVREDCVIPSPGPTALFDETLGAPKCGTQAAVCDSGDLLLGRAFLGPEPNYPNTIDSCVDGDGICDGYLGDESVQQITVSSVGGGVLQEVSAARIDVQLHRQYGYVYYTADANSSPTWTLIGEIPSGCPGGCTSYSFDFTLCSGLLQAVRVVFGDITLSESSCNSQPFTDIDDVIFTVAPGTTNQNCGGIANID